MTMSVPDPGTLPAQMPIPVNGLPAQMTFGIPTLLAASLGLISGLSATGMSLGMNGGTIPLQTAGLGAYDSVTHTMPASAGSDPFSLPEPGSYPVTMPTSFHLVGALSGTPFDATCLTDSATQIGTLVVGKSSSSTDAKLVKKRIPKNRAAKVRVTVARQFGAPADGRVKIKKGTHRIAAGTLSGGSVTIKTPTFKKPGRYVLRVRYVGDQISGGSSDKVVVRVLKRGS